MACRKDDEAVKRLFLRHFTWFSRKMDKDAVDSYAAQTSFWVLIAFIPFTMFVLTLLQTIRIENTSLLFAFADLLPQPVSNMLHTLFSEIEPPSGLISMTAILCVWSASNGTLALVKGLYSVFDVSRKRGFIMMRILAIFYTLLLAVVLLISLGLILFGRLILDWLAELMPSAFPVLLPALTPIFGFSLLLAFFWLMFLAVPRKRVGLRSAFAGAAFAAAGWMLFSFFFSVFVENFSNYSTLYGSLAAIVILMMWLYFCMFILLIGGETAMWLQHSSIRKDLRALYNAGRRAFAAQKGPTHGKKNSK